MKEIHDCAWRLGRLGQNRVVGGGGRGERGRGVAWNGERGSVFTGVKWGTKGERERQIKKRKNRGVRRRFSVAVTAKSCRLPEGKDSFLTDTRVLIDLHVSTLWTLATSVFLLPGASSPTCTLALTPTLAYPPI